MTKSLSETLGSVRLGIRGICGWTTAVVLLASLAACKESVIPYFAAPTSVPASAVGVQQAVTGLFGQTRGDQVWFLMYTSAWARNGLVFFSSMASSSLMSSRD